MKKYLRPIICLILLAVLVISFCACGENTVDTDTDTESNISPYGDTRFYDFETGLIGKKLPYKEVHQLDVSSTPGCKEGWKYRFDNTFIVELYTFDKDSDSYKSFAETNYITSLGNPIPVKFNGTICIYISNWQDERVDAVYDVFKNLKN